MADLRQQESLKSQLSALSTSLGGNLPLDDAIRDGKFYKGHVALSVNCVANSAATVLPQGTKVDLVHSHGMSAWSFTIKIEGVDKEGKRVAYFSKVSQLDLSRPLWTFSLT